MRTLRPGGRTATTKQRRIARHGRSPGIAVPAGIDPAGYLDAFYGFASEEDLDAPPATLATAALDQLRWGATRRPGRPKVRVFNPDEARNGWSSSHTIIQTITDDSPFIVDSVTMRINRSSDGVLKIIHPVFRIERQRGGRIRALAAMRPETPGRAESWMHVEIPRIIDRGEIAQLKVDVESTLSDVKLAVDDWQKMLAKIGEVTGQLESTRRRSDARAREVREFMDWLAENHFTFLGYCEYTRSEDWLEPVAESGLGLLRESRNLQTLATGTGGRIRTRAARRHELSITKAPIRSTIHRPAPLDDVSVSLPADDGARREHRFLGLFTSTAYTEPPGSIPVLRAKVDSIMKQSGLDPASHKGKALQHILDSLPRDELLQASENELNTMALGILALEGRRRIRVFVRLDSRGNFYSCLVFLPADQFTGAARRRVESILAAELDGTVADSQATLTESSLARLTVAVAVEQTPESGPDLKALNAALADAATPWPERVREALLRIHDETRALELHRRFSDRFPAAYRDTMSPERACRDIAKLAMLDAGTTALATILERKAGDGRLRFSVFRADGSVPLYLVHPILENMGLRVVSESNYQLTAEDMNLWIQDFELDSPAPIERATRELAERFQRCFAETLGRRIEDDEFNSLVLRAGLDWQQANLLRAYCKYLLQTGLRFSQRYMLATLARFPALTRALVALFDARFDPDLPRNKRSRIVRSSQKNIQAALERVVSLDDDRILRAFTSVVQATLRTNFFQTGNETAKDYISFKLDPGRIADLPQPRPKFEIFVYAKHVEGIHLRCGPVARGGIRWSDRREDFRTEILGLMKAQQVKNTVIVPAGAKGGFVCKQLPEGNDRAALRSEVVRCYKTFLRGLLDITDNIVADEPVGPPRVICIDDPDPYLVVAADKGTATFSDVANQLAAEYDFWLGDAFASGGSAGYDHKKMGITARGAWESVKRHFRELGLDTQSEDFTVVGIGDMSGDVFGNGLLLSRHARLIAAFNHEHIFIDPDPDPAASYDERRRLFELPRSSWSDYDTKKLSGGGGIFLRHAKSIELSPQARRAIGTERKSLSPPELIRALLKAPVDLLWNGGIGTYVRASTESDLDAGDPVNDSVRVTGAELRCCVIGEGGNLGLTQLGRVEYARAGGRLNTDFIDNSGGVDSSDREVNIKILLSDAIARGKLTPGRRNALLVRMTDAVARQVLANNYAQTQALSMMAAHARERLGEHARLIRLLEGKGLLDREIEFLPSDEQIEERRNRAEGLTRPELAVILSYAKIQLFESLVATDIVDEPHCASELLTYFPEQLARNYPELIRQHRLGREIVAMLISSSITNRMGPFFALRTQEDTGTGPAQVARAYAAVRLLFGTRALWLEIEALDGRVKPQVQYECFYQASRMVRRAVYWYLHRHPEHLDITRTIDDMQAGVTAVVESLPDVLCGQALRRFDRETREYEGLGLPGDTALRIASLRFLTQALDIVELAIRFDLDARTVARLHFELGRGLRLDWMREQIEVLEPRHRWHATARGTLRESVGREQQALLAEVLARSAKGDLDAELKDWLSLHGDQISRTKRTFDEMRSGGEMDFATLSIALREVSRLRR